MAEHGTLQRSRLCDRVVAAFAAQPEIIGVHAFGREVENKCDEYSDLDLVICSSDLAASQRRLLSALNAISPIIGAYHIVCEPRHLAIMVMLRDYSPYHKLDLSLSDDLESKSSFGPFKCLYTNRRPPTASPTTFSFNGERETLANRLNDQLFAIPRFTKCLFRRGRVTADAGATGAATGSAERRSLNGAESWGGGRTDCSLVRRFPEMQGVLLCARQALCREARDRTAGDVVIM